MATAELAAAPPPARPAALLRRAREAFATARKLHAAQGGPFAAVWPPARERFLAYCGLAIRDLDELLVAHPRAPEAAEAMFTMGRIHDYPYLNLFDEALAAYRLTIERHPGTPWARQAAERIAVIEGIVDAGKDSRHEAPAPQPGPTR